MPAAQSMVSGQVHEVTIEKAAPGGNCIAHLPDGMTVFVPFCLPGERVKVSLAQVRSNYAQADLVEVLSPSPRRITARCRHYGVCGGCHYQHMAYEEQLTLKRELIVELFTRTGRFENPAVNAVIPSPEEWQYRNSLQFHLSPGGKPGFHQNRSNEVVEITECHLGVPAIEQLRTALDIEPSPALKRILVRRGSQEEDLLIGFEYTGDMLPEFNTEFPCSAVVMHEKGDVLLSGAPYNEFELRNEHFIVSAGSFFQVNAAQAAAMVEYLLEKAALKSGDTVFDLYCGVGLFSKFIAPRVKEVAGVELSESACDDYAVNLDGNENVSLYVGSVEDVLPALPQAVDVIILDPPRAGLTPGVIDVMLRTKARQVVYVSCDPATLARDCRTLADGGFRIDSIQPFDLFPQTFHVETVVLLSRVEE